MPRRDALPVRSLFACLSLLAACDCDDGGGLVDVAPELVVEPASIDFGEVRLGEFRVRGVELRNKGQLGLAFEALSLDTPSGAFGWASDVPMALAPDQRLALNLTFEPKQVGEDTATIRIRIPDVGERTIAVRGVGVQGGVAIQAMGDTCDGAEGSLSFGRVSPNTTARRSFQVVASGSASVRVLSVVMEPGSSSEFAVDPTPDTGLDLAPGASHSFEARYTPIDGGADAATIIVTTDAPDRPSIRIPVCGVGTAPALCAPARVDLGPVAVGGTARRNVRLESCGTEDLSLSAVALSMDAMFPTAAGWALTPPTGLPATLPPGMSLEVEVAYTAAALGPSTGHLRADSNDLQSPAHVQLVARGAQPCDVSVAPAMLSWFGVAPGSTDTKSVLIANDGATACTVSRLEITAGGTEFRLPSPVTVPATLAPGGSLIVDVAYAPTGAGPHMGTLTLEEGGGTQTIDLVGNPEEMDGCQVDVTPAFVNMGVVAPGTTRTAQINLTNVSSDPCFLRGTRMAAGSDPQFSNTSPNLGLLIPGRSRQLSVTFRPTQTGPARGALEVTTNDVDTPTLTVPVFATSGESGICVSPLHLPFGPTMGIETMDFTIYACGGRAVTVTALDWTTPDAELSLMAPPSLPLVLQAGDMRTITVRYAPNDAIGDTAVVTVRSDDLAQPAIDVLVTGGPEIVPAEAGRYLYFWQIPTPVGGDVVRMPLQGAPTLEPYWGPRTGKGCTGCHEVSPDGRYVALIEFPSIGFRVIDTTTDIALSLPAEILGVEYISWRPDVNTTPAYQFAYGSAGDIKIAALFDGVIGDVQGANDPMWHESMPSWGPDGRIAFVRGMVPATNMNGGTGYQGPTDVLTVPETGGTATPLAGASGNMMANYYPRYSPNGRWIAITQSRQASSTISAADAQLRLVPADNSGMVRSLTTINGTDGASSYATWAVDGSYVSFSSNRSGGLGDWDIYVAPVDPMSGADGAATNVRAANSSGFEHAAQWSP